jgi:multiple sugar transport system permease protein
MSTTTSTTTLPAPTITDAPLAEVGKHTPLNRLARILLYAILLLCASLFLAPFVWLITNSLKDSAHAFDANFIPTPIEWSNYVTIFNQVPLLQMARNSVIVAVLGVVSVVFSSSLIAYGLARLRFPGRNIVFLMVLGTMMLPGAVTLVPTYLIWKQLGLVNTLAPLWLGNIFGSSFYIFMLRQFFLGIPQDTIDAARVDGANFFGIYWWMMLPLARPALLTVVILEFQAKWNDFIGPLIYIQNPDLRTLPLGLQLFVQDAGYGQFHWELLFAASVLVTLPMVILFFVAQKQFIQGIATTGVKG